MKFHILLMSSLYFGCDARFAFTIISYPELSSAYAFRLKGFQIDKFKDPFLGENVQHRLTDICEQISQSTFYLLLEKDPTSATIATNDRPLSADKRTSELIEPLKIEYRRLETRFRERWSHLFPFIASKTSTAKQTELREQQMYWDDLPSRYRPFEVKIRKSDGATTVPRVNLFPCPEKFVPREYRFITYGFHEDFIYLFVRHQREDIVFGAIVERTPDLSMPTPTAMSEKVLEKYFVNAIRNRSIRRRRIFTRERIPLPLAEDPVCRLNRNQRFRLCSLAHETLFVRDDKNEADKFVFNRVDTCVAQKSLLLKEVLERPDKYYTKEIHVNALPCFMLNEDGSTGTLYVTHDPREFDSVFLFVLGREFVMKGTSMLSRFHVIKAHIRNVTVLKHVKYFY